MTAFKTGIYKTLFQNIFKKYCKYIDNNTI